jgi:hypothetical protein
LSDVPLTEQLMTTATASYCTGVTVAAIRKWVQRGHLEVAARDYRGRPLFRWIDVVRAERSTRSGAGRVHVGRLVASDALQAIA